MRLVFILILGGIFTYLVVVKDLVSLYSSGNEENIFPISLIRSLQSHS